MDRRNRRRSDRVSLSVPVVISWPGTSRGDNSEMARTLAVSRHGAMVVLRRKPDPAQEVTIRCSGSEKTARARIVGQTGQLADGFIYGLAFVDPSANLWNIEFPVLTEADTAVSRSLLECSACHSREVVHLDELQTEVFELSRQLSRPCTQCAAWTLWAQAAHEASPDQETGVAAPAGVATPAGAADSAPAPAIRKREERKHVRVKAKLTACIRRHGFSEEVVQIENVSRGGFCFLSANTYAINSQIEVAVPYTPGAANIFVPGQVIREREIQRKTGNKKEYGVRYTQST